ncbi:MAG: hypothetical protein KOO69_06635 [Victivallales bacterium]|nr:hypothetical protein [Victivallales bacterium]
MNNWKWLIKDTTLLCGWFERWEDFSRNSLVKQNPVRIVFKVEDRFYVKVEQPVDFWRKLRNFFSPKAAKEFSTGCALEAAGVPVVKHLGWARRGSSNMLLTKAVLESCSVHEYWYNEIIYGSASKKNFLENFAGFLKLFFKSGFYHPDFHIGNILYSPATESFALVDVYGVYRPNKLSERQINRHKRIFLELYRGLSDSEAVDFLMKVRNELTLEEAGEFWRAGLIAKAARIQKDWSKRRSQIENYYSKFVKVSELSGKKFIVRKIFGSTPAVSLNTIPDCLNENYFNIMRLPHGEAEALWLESFRLELLGVDHLRALVFEKPDTLYLEKAVFGSTKAPKDKIEEFITRAKTAGVEINGKSLLQLPGNRIVRGKI